MKRLPDDLRLVLRRPLGPLFKDVDEALKTMGKPKLLVSVGDVVTAELVKRGILPDLAIIDHRVKRVPIPEEMKALLSWPVTTVKVNNPRSTITNELLEAIKLPKPLRIEIDGEDDLAALACGFLLPEGSLILYGQPEEGVVAISVTEERRKEFLRLFEKFL